MSYDGTESWFERFEAAGKATARKVGKLLLRWRLKIKITISFWRPKE